MSSGARKARDWSQQEVGLIVGDYFAMLRAELLGRTFSKKEHREQLKPLLDGRSDGSVEFKHENISAVLVRLGCPYINGYKPRGNYQSLLAQEVDVYLSGHPEFFDALSDAPRLNPDALPVIGTTPGTDLFESPPERVTLPDEPARPWLSLRGRRIDFVRRDAENRRLGQLGEEFAVAAEKKRLLEAGRDDLANRIEWVAQSRGDGIGFDILSFDEQDDSERLVEVKTTPHGKFFPFYVSVNEVRCSEDMERQYHLYRVFDFSAKPRIYVLHGALSKACRLDPVQYRAAI